MKGAFPAELHASAAALGMFGGKIVAKKLCLGERSIAKAVAKGGHDLQLFRGAATRFRCRSGGRGAGPMSSSLILRRIMPLVLASLILPKGRLGFRRSLKTGGERIV